MKTKSISILTIITSLLLVSCLPEKLESEKATEESVTITVTDTGEEGNGGDNGNNGNNGGGGTTGTSSCTGTSSDGVGDGSAVHSLNLMLAGHQAWMPGNYTDPLAMETMPTVHNARLLFISDSRLKVRLKIHSQPFPTAGETYCYGRNTGQSSDAYPYTKLRFRLHLRDVMCNNPDPNNNNNCLSGFYLGSRYRTQYIDPVNVDSCSPIIDVGSMRNQTQFGTVIEVEDVKADSTCQSNGTYCPAEKIVRAASCWRMTLQIATDYTQDLK